MKYPLIITSLVIGLMSLPTYANHGQRYTDQHYNHSGKGHFYDYAKVNTVTPIIKTVEHRIPEECRYETHTSHQRRSSTPMIIGSIIGAALGNELGHNKSNKRVGAVAGGILGASIGSDIGRRQPQQHCETQYTIEYEEQVVGYDVSYRYRGQSYHTQTRQHPGKRIQLKLRFEPVL